jgi:DNA-binding MarR family transcriptional regulator
MDARAPNPGKNGAIMPECDDDMDLPAADSAGEIIESIHAFRRLVRALQHRAVREGPHHDLTPMEGQVLRFLGRHPGAAQSELVTHSVRDKGQMARLISGLRDRGLVEARVDESDRRVHRLYLTSEGAEIDASVQRRRMALARIAASGLDEAERRQLIDLLGRLRVGLEAGD